MRPPLFALLLLALLGPAHVLATPRPLLLTFINKPPYYYLENERHQGFLLKRAQQLFGLAGIPIQLEERPAKRVLAEMEQTRHYGCSIGWFKTTQRERFARFSQPIHRDRSMVVVANLAAARLMQRHHSFAELSLDPHLRIGISEGYSYGTALDVLIGKMEGRVERTSGTPMQNVAKVALGRVDYTLVDPDELNWMLKQPDLFGAQLKLIKLDDMPAGNLRHLMCNQAVPEHDMARINKAIEQMGLVFE